MPVEQIILDPASWPVGLRDARAKIERAEEHIEALQAGIDAYLEEQPFELDSTFEQEAGCHVVRMQIKQEPPPRLGTIVGDVAHNLRSALDSVSWRLAVVHVGFEEAIQKRRAIDFPITETREQFEGDRAMKFVSDDARVVFERVQPYNRRFMTTADAPLGADPLILLQGLSNGDKHCAPAPAFVAVDGMVTMPGVRKPHDIRRVIVESKLEPGGTTYDRQEISRVTFPPEIPPEDTDLKLGQPILKLTFANGADPENLMQTTNMIAAVVQDFSDVIAAG